METNETHAPACELWTCDGCGKVGCGCGGGASDGGPDFSRGFDLCDPCWEEAHIPTTAQARARQIAALWISRHINGRCGDFVLDTHRAERADVRQALVEFAKELDRDAVRIQRALFVKRQNRRGAR